MQTEQNAVYNGGAKRSGFMPKYVKIPHSFIKRIAVAMANGSHYDEGLPIGAQNWKLGDRQFALDALDHAVAHLLELKDQCIDGFLGDPDPFAGEDNLAHLGANLVMIDFYQQKGLYSPEQSEATVESEVDNSNMGQFNSSQFDPQMLPETQERTETLTARLKRILTGAAA